MEKEIRDPHWMWVGRRGTLSAIDIFIDMTPLRGCARRDLCAAERQRRRGCGEGHAGREEGKSCHPPNSTLNEEKSGSASTAIIYRMYCLHLSAGAVRFWSRASPTRMRRAVISDEWPPRNHFLDFSTLPRLPESVSCTHSKVADIWRFMIINDLTR